MSRVSPGSDSDYYAPSPVYEFRPDEILEPERPAPRRPTSAWTHKHAILFLLTCLCTYLVQGPWYAVSLMTILLCHEFGHYIQARRYGVPASLPYFIPWPLSPMGTMGAVIAMRGHMGSRKALFDIGISGPLAGLVPTLICCIVGVQMSVVAPIIPGAQRYGDPLLYRWIASWYFGPVPPGHDVYLHPIAFAGWVGLLITAINLFPIGQLDGGHILYALLRKKAHIVAQVLLYGAIAASLLTSNPTFAVMLVLLMFIGPKHPPTADDEAPLGLGRTVLGWLTLAFLFIGFTPEPFIFGPEDPPPPAADNPEIVQRLEPIASPVCLRRSG